MHCEYDKIYRNTHTSMKQTHTCNSKDNMTKKEVGAFLDSSCGAVKSHRFSHSSSGQRLQTHDSLAAQGIEKPQELLLLAEHTFSKI